MAPVFFAFRAMVGTGLLMLGVSWYCAARLLRRKELPVAVLRLLTGMTFVGWVGVVCGWYVTETGRQPWLVTGVLKTADAVGNATAPMVGTTLSMYLVTYGALIVAYVATVFHLAKKATV